MTQVLTQKDATQFTLVSRIVRVVFESRMVQLHIHCVRQVFVAQKVVFSESCQSRLCVKVSTYTKIYTKKILWPF